MTEQIGLLRIAKQSMNSTTKLSSQKLIKALESMSVMRGPRREITNTKTQKKPQLLPPPKSTNGLSFMEKVPKKLCLRNREEQRPESLTTKIKLILQGTQMSCCCSALEKKKEIFATQDLLH
jgi:hypothetical protein